MEGIYGEDWPIAVCMCAYVCVCVCVCVWQHISTTAPPHIHHKPTKTYTGKAQRPGNKPPQLHTPLHKHKSTMNTQARCSGSGAAHNHKPSWKHCWAVEPSQQETQPQTHTGVLLRSGTYTADTTTNPHGSIVEQWNLHSKKHNRKPTWEYCWGVDRSQQTQPQTLMKALLSSGTYTAETTTNPHGSIVEQWTLHSRHGIQQTSPAYCLGHSADPITGTQTHSLQVASPSVVRCVRCNRKPPQYRRMPSR